MGFFFDMMYAARGKHWYVTDDRLRKAGAAYANLIQYYVPFDGIGQGAAWWTAIMATGSLFGPAVMTEMQMAEAKRKSAQAAAVAEAEGVLRAARRPPQRPGPVPPPAAPPPPPANGWAEFMSAQVPPPPPPPTPEPPASPDEPPWPSAT